MMYTNDNRLYHKIMIRMDNELMEKLYNYAADADMKLSGIIRRSLRQYLQKEESQKEATGKKQEPMK